MSLADVFVYNEALREAVASCRLDGETQVIVPTEDQWVDKCHEAADLRDAVRLIIGRSCGVPWDQVDQSEVAGYLEEIKKLKAIA